MSSAPAPTAIGSRDLNWLLQSAADYFAEQTCLVWRPDTGPARSWSYPQFHEDVRSCANGLQRAGIRVGDRVVLHSENCPEIVVAWYACGIVGAIAVTTNARSTAAELGDVVQRTLPTLAIVGAASSSTFTAACELAGAAVDAYVIDPTDDDLASGRQTHCFSSLMHGDVGLVLPERDAGRPLGIQFTSGSTARPKGVVWTHANALWGGFISSQHQQLTADDVYLTCLPFYHTNAQSYSVLASLWVGATIVLVPKFSASRFWRVSLDYRCTRTSLVPFCLAALRNVQVPERHYYRTWGLGVAHPEADAHFGVRIIGWWGMTETVAQGIVTPPRATNPFMSMGRVSPAYDIELRDANGRPVGTGETGEICVRGRRGESLFLEYYQDETATEAAFWSDGAFRTGDLARREQSGDIFFVSRISDIIKCAGENVSPAEVEAVIAGVDGVREVAVVGEPSAMYGERPVAFCVADRRSDETLVRRIHQACARQLAVFKRPGDVWLIDALPKTALGKIAKGELRKRLAKGHNS